MVMSALDHRMDLLEWISENPYPSMGEMLGSGIYKSRGGVKRALEWLKEEGLIDWTRNVARSITTTRSGEWVAKGDAS